MDNQQTNPGDYLNQIAPPTPRRIDFFRQKPILIGLVVVAVLIVAAIFALIFSSLSSGTIPTKRLAARLMSTENTVGTATVNIKSTKLRALNSNLKIYMTNTIRDITPILTEENIDIKKLDKKITSSESNAKMLATLEDARLNAVYDRTYAREMAYQLDTILSLMRQISSSTDNKGLVSFLDNAIKNLAPTQKQFADFNAANS